MPPSSDGKAKPSRRKSPKPKPPTPDVEAQEAAEHFCSKSASMVDSAAAIEANRKRSTTVDAPDYEAAFDQLVGRTRRQTLSLFIADLMAIVVSIAVDLSTDTPDMRTAGNLLMSVGCLMSFFGIMFKSIAPK